MKLPEASFVFVKLPLEVIYNVIAFKLLLLPTNHIHLSLEQLEVWILFVSCKLSLISKAIRVVACAVLYTVRFKSRKT